MVENDCGCDTDDVVLVAGRVEDDADVEAGKLDPYELLVGGGEIISDAELMAGAQESIVLQKSLSSAEATTPTMRRDFESVVHLGGECFETVHHATMARIIENFTRWEHSKQK